MGEHGGERLAERRDPGRRAPTTPARRLGHGAAVSMAAVGVAYAAALAAGFARYGLRAPITDPLLGVMEALTFLSAPVLLALVAAVRADAAPARRVYGTLALACMTLAAGLTTAVHFVELTARRQLGASGIAWPSAAYAVELLAWDFWLGLALVCAGAALPARGAEAPGGANPRATLDQAARLGLQAAGALCLAGLVGPLVGRMRLQLVGVFGYAVVLPATCVLLARRFRPATAAQRVGRPGRLRGR